MIIRDRSQEDSPALEAMAMETHRCDGYPRYLPDDLRAFIVNPAALRAWVAVDGDSRLGHVALHAASAPEVMDLARSATGFDSDELVVVARLLVAPVARRSGVGRALLERATGEALQLGRRAVLDVVDEHTAAIALYERCGWSRLGRVDWTLADGRPLREYVYLSPDRAS